MKMRFIPKRKLRAATTARRMPRAAMEDYGQEPNMCFAKAIVVVVVLHLVAVGGIYAFSSIKARNQPLQNQSSHQVKDADAAPATTGDTGDASVKTAPQDATVPALAPVKPAVADVKQSADAKPAEQPVKNTTVSPADSGAFYTVAKGDNPVAIAKKLHVNYDELLKLNKITDPKKLQVGQKLRIPVKKKPMPQN